MLGFEGHIQSLPHICLCILMAPLMIILSLGAIQKQPRIAQPSYFFFFF